jgi:hypothetical protein
MHTQTIEHRIVIVVEIQEKSVNQLQTNGSRERVLGARQPADPSDTPRPVVQAKGYPFAPPFMLPAYHRRMSR